MNVQELTRLGDVVTGACPTNSWVGVVVAILLVGFVLWWESRSNPFRVRVEVQGGDPPPRRRPPGRPDRQEEEEDREPVQGEARWEEHHRRPGQPRPGRYVRPVQVPLRIPLLPPLSRNNKAFCALVAPTPGRIGIYAGWQAFRTQVAHCLPREYEGFATLDEALVWYLTHVPAVVTEVAIFR
jgi:hypothetical protein